MFSFLDIIKMHFQLLILTIFIHQFSCILVNPTTIPVPRNIPNSPTFLPLNENESQSLIPLWKNNIKMNLYLFINTDLQFSDYNATPDWKIDIRNQYTQDKKIQLLIPVNFTSLFLFYSCLMYMIEKCRINKTTLLCSHLSGKRFISN